MLVGISPLHLKFSIHLEDASFKCFAGFQGTTIKSKSLQSRLFFLRHQSIDLKGNAVLFFSRLNLSSVEAETTFPFTIKALDENYGVNKNDSLV